METVASAHILDEFDLGEVAKILNSVFPKVTLCEFVEMLAAVTAHLKTTCSLCGPSKFPACQCYAEEQSRSLDQ